MGDEQKLTPEEQIRTAREAFEDADDFTVAVEEEFAILDPETLGLANRFEELQAAAVGTELEPHLVGELIASEIEIRTGRCADFTEAAARMGERRDQLLALADQMDVVLGGTGTHPWSPALPPQRRGPPLRRVAQQQLRPPRSRRDQRA